MKKIAVIGPESTGKSSLCQQLAEHYKTFWVPEFAREYLLANGINYTYDDLLVIAKGQLASEDSMYGKLHSAIDPQSRSVKVNNPVEYPLIIDTNMYVMKVWNEFVFENCHLWILKMLAERNYDLYLLCNIDLPWMPDELREYPDLESRQKLYHMYKDCMINQQVPWENISGSYDHRLKTAIQAIDKLYRE